MGGSLFHAVIVGLFICITVVLSKDHEAQEAQFSLTNVRIARAASNEGTVEKKTVDKQILGKQKGQQIWKKRIQKRKQIKKKNKTSKKENMKSKRNKSKLQKGKINTRKNKVKKIMQLRRKQMRKSKKANKAHSRQSQTCSGTTPVDSTCMENAMNALVFEANQVANYLKQSKILIRHKDQTGNKQGKKGEFEEAALHMLWAIGGNISDPKCGLNSSDLVARAKEQRDLLSSLSNYDKLKNCSAAIQEACTTPTKSYNATIEEKISICNQTMEDYRTLAASCINLKDSSNATKQCGCWSTAKTAMDAIKKLKCATKENQKEITQNKKACVKVFGNCKKMEDSSVELIFKCMNTHSMYLINQTAESLHSGAMKDTGKSLAGAEETAKQILSGAEDGAKYLDLFGK